MINKTLPKSLGHLASLAFLASMVAACASSPSDIEGQMRFRQEQFRRITSETEFRQCMEAADGMDRQAHSLSGEGKFLLAAKKYEECQGGLKNSNIVDDAEILQAVAMSALDYAKGGDLQATSRMVEIFARQYSGTDLLINDGCSFLDTMRALTTREGVENLRISNTCDKAKDEVRRVQYYSNH